MTPTASRPCCAWTSRNRAAIVDERRRPRSTRGEPAVPACSSGCRARFSASKRVVLGEALRAEHAAVHRVIRVAADADRPAVLDADEHAAADRAVAAGRRHPAVGDAAAPRRSRQFRIDGVGVAVRAGVEAEQPLQRSCRLASELEVRRRHVRRHDADEEQIAAERLRRPAPARTRPTAARGPAATSGSATAAGAEQQRPAAMNASLEASSTAAAPCPQLDAVGGDQPDEAKCDQQRAARPPSPPRRWPRPVRRWRRPPAPSSGPSGRAVRLNWSSVNRVFHAGRDGTR